MYLSKDVDEVLMFTLNAVSCISPQSGCYDPQMIESCHPQTVFITAITERVDL